MNLILLGPAAYVLCLFSSQYGGQLGGDHRSRFRARLAPDDFGQLAANDEPLCLEDYFSSSLHQLLAFLRTRTPRWTISVVSVFLEQGRCDKINPPQIAGPSDLH